MPNNMPGGRLIAGAGGYLNLINALTGAITRLDVARWELTRNVRQFHKGHSGTLGAIATRNTGVDWEARGRVWWDLGNPPDTLLMSGWGCGIQLGMGSRAGQAGYNYTGSAYQFYVSPSGMCRQFTVTDSSEGNDDDRVFADFTIVGNTRLFLLPQETADLNSYVQELGYLGQLTWLPAFSYFQ